MNSLNSQQMRTGAQSLYMTPPTNLSVTNSVAIPLDYDPYLVLHFPFNGNFINYTSTNGTSIIDYIQGATVNTANFVTGNGSIKLSNPDTGVINLQITNAKTVTPTNATTGITVSMWMYYNQLQTSDTIDWNISNITGSYYLKCSIDNTNKLKVTNASLVNILSTPLTVNVWTLITITHNLTNNLVRIYFNNVQNASGTINAGTINDNRFSSISIFNGTTLVTHYVDDYRFYNRTLDSSEILQLYNINRSPISFNTDASLCIYYPFDVSSGNSVYNYAQNIAGVADASFVNGATVNNSTAIVGTGSLLLQPGQYVKLNSTNTVTIINGLSISFWINATAFSGTDTIFDIGNSNTDHIFFTIKNTNMSLNVENINGVDTYRYLTTNATGTWYFVVWTLTNSATGTNSIWNFYVNASNVGIMTSRQYVLQTISIANNNYIGVDKATVSATFNGYIDDFRVFQRVLSDTEIQLLYMHRTILTGNVDYVSWGKSQTNIGKSNNIQYSLTVTDNSLNTFTTPTVSSQNIMIYNKFFNHGMTYSVNAQYSYFSQTSQTNSVGKYIGQPILSVSQMQAAPFNTASLVWSTPQSPNANITYYTIVRSDGVITNITDTSYNSTGITGNTYSYSIYAVDNSGTLFYGPSSNVVYQTLYYVYTPSNFNVSHKKDASGVAYLTTVTLSWTAGTTNDPSGVYYYYSTDGITYNSTQQLYVDLSNQVGNGNGPLVQGGNYTFYLHASVPTLGSYSTPDLSFNFSLVQISTGYDSSGTSQYNSNTYTLYYFTNVGSKQFTVSNQDVSGLVLIVGGGGSGGSQVNLQNGTVTSLAGGGGGGGLGVGVLQFKGGSTFYVTVGDGGNAINITNGGNTTISGGTVGSNFNEIAIGGGSGGYGTTTGKLTGDDGGCGGGGGVVSGKYVTNNGGTKTIPTGKKLTYFGSNGGDGIHYFDSPSSTDYFGSGGGGGATSKGFDITGKHTSDGGSGYQWIITGKNYAGGGGGAQDSGNNPGRGFDGGGDGGYNQSGFRSGSDGKVNTGGGGGGAYYSGNDNYGGNGGSGIAIVAFLS